MLVKTFIGYDLEQVIQDSNIFVLALEKGQFVSTQFNPLLEGVSRTRERNELRTTETETMTNKYRYVAMVYYLDESELERKKEREHLSS